MLAYLKDIATLATLLFVVNQNICFNSCMQVF